MVWFAARLHSTLKPVLLHRLDDLHLHHEHECHVELLAVSHVDCCPFLGGFCIFDSDQAFFGKNEDHFAQVVEILALSEFIEAGFNCLVDEAEENVDLLGSMVDHMTDERSQFCEVHFFNVKFVFSQLVDSLVHNTVL
jgi:hypothetical protein